jgi:hypothetical protein
MPEVRRFLCDGQADDDGCSLSEWVSPINTSPGAIVSMVLCTCSALEGLRSCKHRDKQQGEGHFTIKIDNGGELDEADE